MMQFLSISLSDGQRLPLKEAITLFVTSASRNVFVSLVREQVAVFGINNGYRRLSNLLSRFYRVQGEWTAIS